MAKWTICFRRQENAYYSRRFFLDAVRCHDLGAILDSSPLAQISCEIPGAVLIHFGLDAMERYVDKLQINQSTTLFKCLSLLDSHK